MLSLRRTLFTAFATGLLLAMAVPSECAAAAPIPLPEAVRAGTVHAQVTGNGRDQLRLTLKNPSGEGMQVVVPQGTVFLGENDDRAITLRAVEITIEGQDSMEAEIPAAALASRNAPKEQVFHATGDSEPKLAGLLKLVANQDNIPRATSQLAVLALLENITFAQWQQFLASGEKPNGDQRESIIQAIDALGLLKETNPEGDIALARDNELKLRALRSPITRPKAVQLYGLALPDEPAASGGGVPNLKQLLHTKSGDNCPTCRMRQQAGRGAGDF